MYIICSRLSRFVPVSDVSSYLKWRSCSFASCNRTAKRPVKAPIPSMNKDNEGI